MSGRAKSTRIASKWAAKASATPSRPVLATVTACPAKRRIAENVSSVPRSSSMSRIWDINAPGGYDGNPDGGGAGALPYADREHVVRQLGTTTPAALELV